MRRHCVTATVCLSLLCASIALAQKNTITFNAPGAGNAPGQGTYGIIISPPGDVLGQYIDGSNVIHGFLRTPGGFFITLDAPGAGTSPGQGTLPYGINALGEITGYYTDSSGLSHGFLRLPGGFFIIIDVPGAGFGSECAPPIICSNGTQGAAINIEGTISGQWGDTNGVLHGFVRAPNGIIRTFDVPGSGSGPGQGTLVTFGDGINSEEAIATGYIDSSGMDHGAIRTPKGTFTKFDPPGSVFTDVSGINETGTVAGFYADSSSVYHGYVRAPSGNYNLFDVWGAGTGAGQGTLVYNLNAHGDVAGAYVDSTGVNHGFLRLASGAVTTFNVSGAGTSAGQGTSAYFNSSSNAITGVYVDAKGVLHGFLRNSAP